MAGGQLWLVAFASDDGINDEFVVGGAEEGTLEEEDGSDDEFVVEGAEEGTLEDEGLKEGRLLGTTTQQNYYREDWIAVY